MKVTKVLLSKHDIIELISTNLNILKQRFGVNRIGIFGSYARGEERESSDIDILVEFINNSYRTFDNYMDLKFYLEDLLSLRVDLLTINAIKEELKENILKEVIYIERKRRGKKEEGEGKGKGREEEKKEKRSHITAQRHS